jgi:hypothetical protein
MLNVCTKGILVYYRLVRFKLNGILDFAVTVVTFFRYVYHECVDTVPVTVAH